MIWNIAVRYFFLIVLLLGGCGEKVPGANTANDTVVPVPPFPDTNFLPYEILAFGDATTTKIGLVDSSNVELNSSLSVPALNSNIDVLDVRFYKANYNPSVYSLENHRMDRLLFAQNNQLFQVDLLEVKEPIVEQLSSEFQANSICHQWDLWAEDYAVFDNSRYLYYIADDCQGFDGSWLMVHLAMDVTQPPVNLPLDINYFLASYSNGATGALLGWLLVDRNGSLVQYNTDFTIADPVRQKNKIVNVKSQALYMINNADQQLILAVDEKIIWYNAQTNLAENSLEAFPSSALSKLYQWRSDGQFLYFTVNHFSSDGSIILSASFHRVLLQQATGIELLSTENVKIDDLETGYGGAVYAVNNQLKHYVAEEGVIKPIVAPLDYEVSEYQDIPIFYTSGEFLAVEYSRMNNSEMRLVKLLNYSTRFEETLLDNYIVGVNYEKSWRLDTTRSVDKLVLEASETRSLSAIVLAGYPDNITTLGALPADSNPRSLTRFFARGHDDVIIERVFNSVIELFFVDLTQSNSLRQVTDNVVSERAINF